MDVWGQRLKTASEKEGGASSDPLFPSLFSPTAFITFISFYLKIPSFFPFPFFFGTVAGLRMRAFRYVEDLKIN